MNGGTVWNQDYRGVNRKPRAAAWKGRGQQSRLQRCSQRSARDAIFLAPPVHSGLMPAAFMIGNSRASSASRKAMISAGEVGQDVAKIVVARG
jgi:hypothetical protein